MFNRKNKLGFTIVELVIVIAIIAILAAVLIPTFSNIVRQAAISADIVLVKNLNTILAAEGQTEGANKTMHDALLDAEENGYIVSKLTPTADGTEILWDQVADRFVLLDGKVVIYADESVENPAAKEGNNTDAIATYKLWKIYETAPSAQSYSIYWNSTANFTDALNVGFDAGENTAITALVYNRSDATVAQDDVRIRTNSYDTVVGVNAPKDTVKHFDKANKIDVIAVAAASYHEFGDVLGNITLKNGRVVVEQNAKANAVMIDATAADITAGTVVISANNDAAPKVPIIVRDDVKAAIDANGNAGNSIPTEVPNSDKVIVLSDKVLDASGNKTETTAVAYNKTTKKNYPSLIDAISDASANDVIMLQNNITTDKDVLIDFSLTIDGNGFTLNNTRDGSRAINIGNRVSLGTVVNNVEVTIKNLTIICSGTTGNFGSNGSLEERGLQLTVVENSTINIDNVKFEMGNDYSYSLKPMSSKNVVINVSNSVLTGANCVETNKLMNSTMNFTNTFLHNTYNENIVSHIGSAFNFVSSDGNILNIENCTYAGKNSQKYGYEDGTFNVVNGELEEYKEPVACDVTIMIGSTEWKHLTTVTDLVATYNQNGWDASYKAELRLNANLVLTQSEYDFIVPASVINYNGFEITIG